MKKFKSIHLITIILLVGLLMSLFNYGKSNHLAKVQGHYLKQAVEISQSYVPSNYQRGPVYPFILALSFKFVENKFLAAHWISQLIYLIAILMVFLFTNLLYGKRTAFISSISIMFSIKLFDIAWNIDVAYLIPIFLLASFIFYLQSVFNNQNWKFLLSGFAIGLAFLTKESALFYVPFPISLMFLLKEFRTETAIKGFFLYLTGILMMVLPWILFVYLNNQNVLQIFGEAKLSLLNSYFGTTSFIEFILKIIFWGGASTLKNFSMILPAFLIMMLGIIIIFWGGLKNKIKSDRLFIAIFLPSIPFLMAYGLYLDGFRHIILPIMFFHIALAKLVSLNIRYNKKINKRYLLGIILLMLISNIGRIKSYALEYGRGLPKKIIERRMTGRFSLNVVPGGRFRKSTIEASNWIATNIKEGSLIRSGLIGDAVAFYTNYNYKYLTNLPPGKNLNNIINNNVVLNDQILQITTGKKFREKFNFYRYRKIHVLPYTELVDYLKNITKEKIWILIHKDDKVIYPLVLSLIYDVTNKVYSNSEIIILETLPGEYDFSSIISNIINKDFDIFAKGNEPHLNWLNTKRDIALLANDKPDEYRIYYNYLLSKGINLTKLIEN